MMKISQGSFAFTGDTASIKTSMRRPSQEKLMSQEWIAPWIQIETNRPDSENFQQMKIMSQLIYKKDGSQCFQIWPCWLQRILFC